MNRFLRIFTDALSVFFNNTGSSFSTNNIQDVITEIDTILQSKADVGSNVSDFNNDAGYITLADVPSSNDVQSITGDGVDNTDPQNPILSFPNADQVDDSSTVKKFITQAELNLIVTNTNNIVQNTTDIQDAEVIITQNTNDILNNSSDIQDLQSNKGDMFKAIYDTNDEGIVDKAQSIVYKAQLNQAVVKGNLVYAIDRNLATGNPIVGLADNTVSFADKTVGMAVTNGVPGQVIEILKNGVIESIDTSLFAVGETVFLSTFGTFDQISNITSGSFTPIGFVIKSNFTNGSLIVDTSATESINTNNTLNESTVTGRTVTDALDNLNSSPNGVQSVTGDGVNNVDPLNPVLTFPDADEVDDTTTVNKFVSLAERQLIQTNATTINSNTSRISTLEQEVLDLDANKVESVTGTRVDNSDPLNPIINLPKYVSLQAGLTRPGQSTIPLANQQANTYEEYLKLDYPCTITDNYFISIAFQWSSNVSNTNTLFRLALTDGTVTQFQEVRIESKDTGGTGEVVNVIENGLIVGNVNTGTDIREQEYFPVDVILDAGKIYSVSLEFAHESTGSEVTVYSATIRLEQKTQNP